VTTLFILDTPENAPVVEVAETSATTRVDKTGPYFRIISDTEIVIDRRATGCRHAVWYSAVAGVKDGRIVQWDKDQMKVQGR